MKTHNIILSKYFSETFIYMNDLHNIFNLFFLEIMITSHACQNDEKFYKNLLKWKQMLIENAVATSCHFVVSLGIIIS